MVPEPMPEPVPARILVVEDEVLVRAALADALRGAGFTVIEAGRADAAWSYLSSGGQADLIFSDIHVPGSMDRLELARQIRDQYPSVPIILTSAVGPKITGELGLFVSKPYDLDNAISTIMGALDPSRSDSRK